MGAGGAQAPLSFSCGKMGTWQVAFVVGLQCFKCRCGCVGGQLRITQERRRSCQLGHQLLEAQLLPVQRQQPPPSIAFLLPKDTRRAHLEQECAACAALQQPLQPAAQDQAHQQLRPGQQL